MKASLRRWKCNRCLLLRWRSLTIVLTFIWHLLHGRGNGLIISSLDDKDNEVRERWQNLHHCISTLMKWNTSLSLQPLKDIFFKNIKALPPGISAIVVKYSIECFLSQNIISALPLPSAFFFWQKFIGGQLPWLGFLLMALFYYFLLDWQS